MVEESKNIKFADHNGITQNGRVYNTPVGYCASVTTILQETYHAQPDKKAGLDKWRERVGEEEANTISRCALNRGTQLHNAVEAYLKGESPLAQINSYDAKDAFECVKPRLKLLEEVLHIEKPLYHPKYHYAGRADIIARVNGTVKIIDLKTSQRYKRKEYLHAYGLQCAAYAAAYNNYLTTKGVDESEFALGAELFITVPNYKEAQRHTIEYDELWELVQEYKEWCIEFYSKYPLMLNEKGKTVGNIDATEL